MIRFFVSLFFFFSFPILLLALALKSIWILGFAVACGVSGILYFWFNSYSEFLLRIRPGSMDEALAARLEGLWREAGPERIEAAFYRYRATEPEFKIWVHSPGKVGIFLSQGFLELATDERLIQAFRSLGTGRMRELIRGNRLFSVRLRLDRWKGREEEFRYWLLSFWLYPLERLLKIAKI
jgi:hypothetical protein